MNAVDQGSTPSDGGNHMHGFGHFCQIGPFFQTGLGIGIDAIGTLNRVRDRQGNEGFFTFGQFAFGKYGIIIIEELTGQLPAARC